MLFEVSIVIFMDKFFPTDTSSKIRIVDTLTVVLIGLIKGENLGLGWNKFSMHVLRTVYVPP